MKPPEAKDLVVSSLGSGRIPSPLRGGEAGFIDESRAVLLSSDQVELQPFLQSNIPPPAFEPAGPRSKIFFDPTLLTCGIVTCGGLCPGLNNVIRSIVLMLHYGYGVKHILGFRYGYSGSNVKRGSRTVPIDAPLGG